MHYSVVKFFVSTVDLVDIQNKRILEVGSYNVNGSLRDIIVPTMYPKEYIGIDITSGNYVDQLISASTIDQVFGAESFDVVICTEMLEHAEDWKSAINNMKAVLKCNGLLFLTTRSKGFPLHCFPDDYWRFEIYDMKKIFMDMDSHILLDNQDPGVFVYAKKLNNTSMIDLSNINVYSMKLENQ